jgi:sec-independent protein translocase protein TatC
LVALPVILWQIWCFVGPGLYQHEKNYVLPFVIASSFCFGVGTYFGFFFVFPMVFSFLIKFGTSTGEMSAMLSMGSYLALSSKLLIAFGLVFELPIVIFFLARLGIVNYQWLARNRKFALLGGFLFGAVLTPPDVISQTALALPFFILYEIGIWIARFFGKQPAEEEPAETAAQQPETPPAE